MGLGLGQCVDHIGGQRAQEAVGEDLGGQLLVQIRLLLLRQQIGHFKPVAHVTVTVENAGLWGEAEDEGEEQTHARHH